MQPKSCLSWWPLIPGRGPPVDHQGVDRRSPGARRGWAGAS